MNKQFYHDSQYLSIPRVPNSIPSRRRLIAGSGHRQGGSTAPCTELRARETTARSRSESTSEAWRLAKPHPAALRFYRAFDFSLLHSGKPPHPPSSRAGKGGP